jgi:hypothetical protein
MNGAYAHLILNHFPILGTLFGLVLLAAALIRKSDELQRGALMTFAVVGALSLPAYFSGEGAEEILADCPGVPTEAIERTSIQPPAHQGARLRCPPYQPVFGPCSRYLSVESGL